MSILVYAENWNGRFKKWTFEVLSYANHIAAQTNAQVHALVIGTCDDSELQELARYGAASVLKVNAPAALSDAGYAGIIAAAAEECSANLILMANSLHGNAVAPRAAVRTKAAFASGISNLPESYSPFILAKRSFSGKTIATIELPSGRKLITLVNNSVEVKEYNLPLNTREFNPSVPLQQVQVIDTQVQSGKVLLSEADIVVSGGRGMKGPENWAPLEELAGLLGAATACSRPVSDEGWRPHHEHVGQTGKIIGPTLYFALGISGAIQHLAGVNSSKVIVAVNKDPEAPIFQAADYGIVGDVQKVIPQFIEAVKRIKS